MSLSARTKELLETARRDAEPSAEDLRRVRARLTAAVATEEPALTAVPLAFLKLGGAALALAAVGLGAWQWLRARDVPPSRPTPPAVTSAMVCPAAPECPAQVLGARLGVTPRGLEQFLRSGGEAHRAPP
jgi:hypothetical protein